MDGWMDTHGNSAKQKYATVHGLTVDGATTLETNPPCLPLTSQSEKSKKEQMSNFILFPTFNAEVDLYLYTSKYYTLAEENVTYLPANTHLTVTFKRRWTGWSWVEIIKIFKKYISTCISNATETLK